MKPYITETLTPGEKLRDARIRALVAELTMLRGQYRPAVVLIAGEGAKGDVACPFCGSLRVSYDEGAIISHAILGVTDDVIAIDGATESQNDDCDDGYVWCRDCLRPSRFPDDYRVDWQ